MSEEARKAASRSLSLIRDKAIDVQGRFAREHDGPRWALADAANDCWFNDRHIQQDIVILRGMISARSYEKTPYHEAIVPVLQEALDVLERLAAS